MLVVAVVEFVQAVQLAQVVLEVEVLVQQLLIQTEILELQTWAVVEVVLLMEFQQLSMAVKVAQA
jgi:hypothetical protein